MTWQNKNSVYELPCGQSKKEGKIDIIIITVPEEKTITSKKQSFP